MVCLHGWGLNGALWQDVAGRLAGAVRMPDLPGHGGTPPPPRPERLESWADWAAGLVEGPALWVGWSLGGMVALALAMAAPSRVAGLVLVATTPRFAAGPCWPAGLGPAVLNGFASDLEADPRGTLKRFLALQVGRDAAGRRALQRLRRRLDGRPPPHPAALRGGLAILREADLRPRLASVRVPALVVHGLRDRLVPPAAGRHLAVRLAAGWRPIPGAGHAPPVSHPEAVARAVDTLREALS